MLATLVKVGHALRVPLALHGSTLLKLSHEIDRPLRWVQPPLNFINYYDTKAYYKKQLIMAVPPYMGCPDKVHGMDSEDTGQ